MKKSRIFLILGLGFILGVGIRSWLGIPFFYAYLGFLGGLIGVFLGWRRIKIRILGLFLIILVLGILRYSISIPDINENKIQFYNNQEVTFIGVISSDPDVRKDRVKLKIESQIVRNSEIQRETGVKGKVLVNVPLYPEYHYGDRLEITCQLQSPEPFEEFAYDRYLARYDIYSICWQPKIKFLEKGQGNFLYNFILKIKHRFQEIINQTISEPQASILSAMMLGNRRGIPQEILDQFSIVGTSHIIAISGMHITIVAGILMNLILALGISRQKAFYIATLGLIFFILMVGAPPSAIRAGIMGFLVLLGMKLGRLYRSTNAIILGACLMLLFNPGVLRDDIGFQLSFMAVLGIVNFSPLLEKYFQKIPEAFQIRSSLLMTLSAQITTLPLIIFYFHKLSLVAPLVNVLILPTVPFIMISGFIVGLAGFIWVGLAQILGWLSWLLIYYLLMIVEVVSNFSLAALKLNLHWWFLIPCYFVLGLILNLRNKKLLVR